MNPKTEAMIEAARENQARSQPWRSPSLTERRAMGPQTELSLAIRLQLDLDRLTAVRNRLLGFDESSQFRIGPANNNAGPNVHF